MWKMGGRVSNLATGPPIIIWSHVPALPQLSVSQAQTNVSCSQIVIIPFNTLQVCRNRLLGQQLRDLFKKRQKSEPGPRRHLSLVCSGLFANSVQSAISKISFADYAACRCTPLVTTPSALLSYGVSANPLPILELSLITTTAYHYTL
jgi:hypothetical protein